MRPSERDQPPFVPDPVLGRIGEGIVLREQGEREAARQLFAEIWIDIGGESGDALHRCALAHSMADVQDDVSQELRWDLRALAAAESVTDQRAAAGGVAVSVAAFYPSLHLNLGECYRRLGDLDRAREHLARGLAAADDIREGDAYSAGIRGGLERLAQRLA